MLPRLALGSRLVLSTSHAARRLARTTLARRSAFCTASSSLNPGQRQQTSRVRGPTLFDVLLESSLRLAAGKQHRSRCARATFSQPLHDACVELHSARTGPGAARRYPAGASRSLAA